MPTKKAVASTPETETPDPRKVPLEMDHAVLNEPDRYLVGYLPYLDEVEDQLAENVRAKAENREANKVKTRGRFKPEHFPAADSELTTLGFTQEQVTEQVDRELKEQEPLGSRSKVTSSQITGNVKP